jgi:hypothetical protein
VLADSELKSLRLGCCLCSFLVLAKGCPNQTLVTAFPLSIATTEAVAVKPEPKAAHS